jgi:hypothetical protein
VTIVAAVVAYAGVGGLPRVAAEVLSGQGVHLGAEANGAARSCAAPEDTDYAGLADAFCDPNTQGPQLFGANCRGAVLLVSEFRVGVKVFANLFDATGRGVCCGGYFSGEI